MKHGRQPGTQDGNGDIPAAEPDVPNSPADPAKLVRSGAGKSKLANKAGKRGYLDGQMLIAMPTMGDERFARSVIYVCAHTSDGALGIIINHPASHISFRDLLVQIKVVKGGPVETSRGFVLHSSDFFIDNSTLPIDEGVCLTATLDILKAIARGEGPRSALLALGYAGWAPGQLENEIHQNGWLHCAADLVLIFGQDTEAKYERALKKIGIDLGMLSSEAGHA